MIALVVLAAVLAEEAPRPVGGRTCDRLKPSLFTIEVHSGNQRAKDAAAKVRARPDSD